MRLIVDICLKKAQKGDFETRRHEVFFDRIYRMIPSAGSLRRAQGRQGRQDFCGGGRFGGVAVRLPVDQNRQCPLEASFFGPSQF